VIFQIQIQRFFIISCGVALFMGLAAGCKKPAREPRDPILQRTLTEEEKKAREELHKKSEELHQQTTAAHEGKLRKADQGGGTLTVGAEILKFSELSLLLGPLNTPGDLGGGQGPSELLTPSAAKPSLRISPLGIESATNAQNVAGQSLTISGSSNTVAEITAGEGRKWVLDNAAINFTHADQNVVFFTIEGQAAVSNGENPEKSKVTGELRARVKSGTDSAAPPNP